MNETMRQWQLSALGLGNLNAVSVPVPTPGPGEMLVRVEAVSLNHRDLVMAEHGMGQTPHWPFVPASDMAGEVVAVGDGVRRFAPGARVVSTFWRGWQDGAPPAEWGNDHGPALGDWSGPGMLAEYVLLREDWAVTAPRSLDAVEASTLTCAALTAWFALVETGGLRAGQSVLIQGTGGVALFGLQFARTFGARAIVLSSSDAKLERALALGATSGINRLSSPDWDLEVTEASGGRGVEHVLELAGGAGVVRSLNALAPGGRIAVVGLLDGMELPLPTVPLLFKRATVTGIGVGHRRALEEMIRAIDHNGIKPVIDRVLPFDAVPEAFARLAEGPFGKVVVRVSD
ncbi:NAD(P)-dependent alcohol dehydrogenase [Neisseriaceae bacterium JH1-16]|nr:NAD(P)-dependent alcohol dehydrogenase [Neisseriaceae bacterium JH1-16]